MASRSIATSISNFDCPLSVQFGHQHGTNPTMMTMVLPGNIGLGPLGLPFAVQVSSSQWFGYIIRSTFDREAYTTTLEAVDWRDRLHDTLVFAQFNMAEDDGRHWHLLPNNWQAQQRSYLSRELDQNDFHVFQALPAGAVLSNNIAQYTLYSCYTLLNWLAKTYGFVISADAFVTSLLQTTYPVSVDWNGGVKVIDCIQQLVDKINARFSCTGISTVRITMRGFTDNPFLQAFMNGLLNSCTIFADRSTTGYLMHDRGRRMMIQGDRDRYETLFVCHPNWNPLWTWDLVYGGAALGALLQAFGLTLANKIKDMPSPYWDTETWLGNPDLLGKGNVPLKRTRMEMTIQEYIDQVPFKIYVVDFSAKCIFFEPKKDEFEGAFVWVDRETFFPDLTAPGAGDPFDLIDYPRDVGWDDGDFNSLWPIASKLVSESNTQAIIYGISRQIIEGAAHPFYHQLTFIPKTHGGGASLDIEEIINPSNGRTEYRCRTVFSEPQFFLSAVDPAIVDLYDPQLYQPDLPLVLLAQEHNIYTYRKGPQGLRTREQRVNVSNLSRGFVQDLSGPLDYKEVSILTRNFALNMGGLGAVPAATPVKADDIADSIATQLSFRPSTEFAAAFTFYERAGWLPDGLIDSVTVSWSKDGIVENVNFGSQLDNTRDILAPQMARLSFRFLSETEINRQRLEWSYRMAMEMAKEKAAGKKPDPGDPWFKAGIYNPAMLLKGSGRHGIAKMKVRKADFTNGTLDAIKPGDVVFG